MTKLTKRHMRPPKIQVRLGIHQGQSVFAWPSMSNKDPELLHADSVDRSDFARRTCHFVGFEVLQLKCQQLGHEDGGLC